MGEGKRGREGGNVNGKNGNRERGRRKEREQWNLRQEKREGRETAPVLIRESWRASAC